jgi:hypothetical protein
MAGLTPAVRMQMLALQGTSDNAKEKKELM